MATSAFTQQLANMRNSSLGTQGILLGAKAELMKKEESAIKDILGSYRQGVSALQEGEAEQTTEQQLQNANEQVAPELKDISTKAASMIADMENMQAKKQQMSELYNQTIQQLSTMSTPEAQKVAGALGIEFNQSERMMSDKMQNAQRRMQYENNLYQQENIKQDIEKKTMAIEQAKKDTASIELLQQMIADGEVMGDTNLTFNQASGALGYNPDVIFDKAEELYGDNPAFAGASLLLDNYVTERTRNFRPPPAKVADMTGPRAKEADLLRTGRWLQEQTQLIDLNQYGEDRAWVRDAYEENATPEEVAAMRADPSLYYKDLRLINQMDGGYAKDVAKETYSTFYDSQNENLYWKVLDKFQKNVRQDIFTIGKDIKADSKVEPGAVRIFSARNFRLGDAPKGYKSVNKTVGYSTPAYEQLPYSQAKGEAVKKYLKENPDPNKILLKSTAVEG